MEGLQKECERLQSKSNLGRSIKDINSCLDALLKAREAITSNPSQTPDVLKKLETKVKDDMNKANENLKEVHSGLTKYGKAIEKRYKVSTYPISDYDVLSNEEALIDRAIAMHLVREGQFEVAEIFMREAKVDDLPSELQTEFAAMYRIKEALKKRDLRPAIVWAASKRDMLERRGSNLEFELHRLMFVHLFTSGPMGPPTALAYGRQEFGKFQQKYLSEITKLTGALAFIDNLASSPYADLFNSENSWTSVSNSFTREFCSLLQLSAESPLYIAVSTGSIALATLIKMSTIMKEKRTEWTSRNELPVEIPLPPKYQYHSIFVCPVSKEQTTEENPPMMLPCGHVIAQESLSRLSKGGTRFKCPYCPTESEPKDAKRVYL